MLTNVLKYVIYFLSCNKNSLKKLSNSYYLISFLKNTFSKIKLK